MTTAQEPRSVIETRLTHDMHRQATTLLAEAAARREADVAHLTELRDFLVATLRHHHESEDHDLWPMIEAVSPGASEPLKALSDEHDALDAALDALEEMPVPTEGDRRELATAAAALRDLVHTHLSHEEPLLFPALQEHVSPETWEAFALRVITTTPPVGASLLVGFFDEVGTPEEVALILSALPAPAQAGVPAMRAHSAAVIASLRKA
ncbi:hemerythrin domain-containing protein [Micromonospora musae]|uniref:Hemerythrin domain-containing protein n=1 Tax=Micromonospora musae TaxID=1894970 RepID=A0A3A9XX59_9ACTN|nr:hemerythrin domain-containing protein [Micromonospora musae]RKN14556.1 hemerythrin domain-containing protein [Micromonospora musae]RKN29669.1 hemerythrin domain-containing protein [Micromonospora musae]